MTDAGDHDEMLTVEDLCAWWKVTKAWVYDEVEAGRLPYVRLGRRHLRFRRRDLQLFLDDRTRTLGGAEGNAG